MTAKAIVVTRDFKKAEKAIFMWLCALMGCQICRELRVIVQYMRPWVPSWFAKSTHCP
jgi:hypothetical protein